MFKKPPSDSTEKPSGSRPAERPPEPDTAPPGQDRVKEHKRSFLSPSISLTADISGTEDLVLDGQMEGNIDLPDNEVFIGPGGRVKANVTAMRVSIEGRLIGDIRGGERVVVKQSGRVEGNIKAPRVVLEDGCQFKGSVEMNIEPESESSKTQSASVASGPKAGGEAKPRESKSGEGKGQQTAQKPVEARATATGNP